MVRLRTRHFFAPPGADTAAELWRYKEHSVNQAEKSQTENYNLSETNKQLKAHFFGALLAETC